MKVAPLDENNIYDEMLTASRNVSLADNMSGQIVTVEIPVGQTVAIPHNLKIVPKYRIILRQEGDLFVVDGDKEWTDKAIYLKAISTTVTVTNPVTTIPTKDLGGVNNGTAEIPANISTATVGQATSVKLTILIMRD